MVQLLWELVSMEEENTAQNPEKSASFKETAQTKPRKFAKCLKHRAPWFNKMPEISLLKNCHNSLQMLMIRTAPFIFIPTTSRLLKVFHYGPS